MRRPKDVAERGVKFEMRNMTNSIQKLTRRLALAGVAAFGLGVVADVPTTQAAKAWHPEIKEVNWSFSGPFGQYDPAQLQRGLKVYREVCAACHGISYVPFRTLTSERGPMLSEEAAQTLAAEYLVMDGPNEEGDMFERPARLSDRFPPPFPNRRAAEFANNGAYPPDLSLIAKARAEHRGFPRFVFDIFTQYQALGADYVYSLLVSYEEEPPADIEMQPGLSYNPAFLSGPGIAMAQPLYDEMVEYTDGTPMTVDQYSKDVSAFLMWTAEPHLEVRKMTGFSVLIFMIVFAGLLYFTKERIWARVEH